MLGFGALGQFALGQIGNDALALTSDILQDVITRLVNTGFLPQPPAQLHHFTSLETACRIIECDNIRLSHAEYSNDQTEMGQAKDVILAELAAREVMVGPSGHQALSVRAMQKLLNQKARTSVVINSSAIPYRGLS